MFNPDESLHRNSIADLDLPEPQYSDDTSIARPGYVVQIAQTDATNVGPVVKA